MSETDYKFDQDLVERARRGEQASAQALIERHQERIHRLAYRLTGDSDVAADVAQDTFLRMLQHLHRIDDPKALTAWLMRTCTNLSRDRWRAVRNLVEFDEITHEPASDMAGPDGGAAAQMSERIQLALMELPHRYREAFVLRHVEELTHEQMCAELELSLSAVKVRIHRACRMLRELLPEYGACDPS